MASITRIDRRADHYIASKPRTLDFANDVAAAMGEMYRHLDAAHSLYWQRQRDDSAFLRAITRANELRAGALVSARAFAGDVEDAPVIPVDQIPMWQEAAAAA